MQCSKHFTPQIEKWHLILLPFCFTYWDILAIAQTNNRILGSMPIILTLASGKNDISGNVLLHIEYIH